jgi:F-type H+-transporting ATPase subunit b
MSLLSVSIFNSASSTFSGAFSEGAVNVDLDLSLFVYLGLFLVLLSVLKPTLFDPMMRLFEEREKRIEGTRRKATKEDQRSAEALAQYEAILAKAREAGNADRDVLRAEGARKEGEIMTQVRAQTAATLGQGRAAIGEEAKAARAKLKSDAASLGRDIAARVLGREVSP